MSLADDYAAELGRWDTTGDLQKFARGIGAMFSEVELYAADIDDGGVHWVPEGYLDAVRASAPIAWWRLGDLTATAAADAEGTHPGTYNGTVTLNQANALTDEPGASVLFDGSTGYVDIPWTTALSPSEFTAEMWVHPADSVDAVLFNDTDASIDKGFYISMATQAPQAVVNTTGSPVTLSTGDAMTVGAWNHVALTYDGVTAALYLNGQPVDSAPATFVPNDGSGGTGADLSIANFQGAPFFHGNMQEVALYNRALTATEVAHHAAQQVPGGRWTPSGARVGWQALWDYTIAPSAALPWICMVYGETAPQGATDDQLRALIQAAPNSRRGTPRAIAEGIKQTLTGGQLVGIRERWRSDTLATDDNALSIFTYLSQTPDQNAVQQAIRRTVPADINVYYTALTGPTWDALQTAAGGGTWSALVAHYGGGTWADVESEILALPGYTLY